LFQIQNLQIRFSESQSVSVNVGNSKEVKQESGKADGNQSGLNSFADAKQNVQAEQHCMNGGVSTLDDVYTSELEVRLVLHFFTVQSTPLYSDTLVQAGFFRIKRKNGQMGLSELSGYVVLVDFVPFLVFLSE